MADPTARFVITASDQTRAAIASADRGLKQLGRSVTSVRSLMAGFGVVLSGRALLGWITNAVKAADATGEHAKQIKAAQDAMASMKKASDELALSIGTSLTPAFQGLGKVLQGLNTLFFNADPVAFEQQIKDVEERIREMRKHAIDTGIGELIYSKEDQARLDQLNKQLEELIKKQRIALGFDPDPNRVRPINLGRNLRTLNESGLDSQLALLGHNVKLRTPNVKLDDLLPPDELADIVVTAKEMSVDDLMRQMPDWRKAFEPIRKEATNTADFIGGSFQDAFTGWLIDGELKFKDFLRRMTIQLGTSALFNMLGTAFPGVPILGKLFGGSRASGGPVSAGMMYRVHEGEGFFTPGRDGRVGATGGGAVNYYDYTSIDARGADQSLIARLPGVLAENRRQTQAELRELMRRRRF